MEDAQGLLVDARNGFEYRAVERSGGLPGWSAQWRPLRAIESFRTFSFITRSERFGSRDEALDFIRKNGAAIAGGLL